MIRSDAAVVPAPPRRVVLGREVATGLPFRLPFDAFMAGVNTMGGVGSGKTNLWRRFLFKFGLFANILHLDYAGTGHRFFHNWIALVGTTCAWYERRFPRELRGLTTAFLSRFAFLTIDDFGESPVRFDLLRRRSVPSDGRLETISAVRSRVLRALDMRKNEENPQTRVQYRRIGGAMLTLLIAANRPISEIELLLDRSEAYYGMLRRTIEASTYPHELDRLAIQSAFRQIDGLWQLPPMQYTQQVLSTRNAFDDFLPGHALGQLFSDETFPIEELAYGTRSLVVASSLTDVHRAQAYQMILAMFQSQVEGRVATRPVCAMFDEIGHLTRFHQDTLARSRNFGVSYFHAFQGDQQWRDLDMPEMPQLIRKMTSLDIRFRPTEFDEAQDLARRLTIFRADQLFLETVGHGSSTANGMSNTITDSWSDAQSTVATTSSADSRTSGTGRSDALGRSMHPSGDMTLSDTATTVLNDAFAQQWGTGASEGTTSTRGGSVARGTSQTVTSSIQQILHRVPIAELEYMETQRLARVPTRTAFVTRAGQTTEVATYRAAEIPAELLGVPIAAHLKTWHDHYWSARAAPRAAFDPSITLSAPETAPPSRRGATAEIAAPPALPAVAPPADAFPSPRLTGDGATRLEGVLATAATVRLCTVLHLAILAGWSYDAAYRALDRLATDRLLDRIRPYAPRGEGSAPIFFVLTAAGAQALAATGGDGAELERIAKNLGVFRRTVEANRPAQTEHRLWSSLVATLLVAASRAADATAYASGVRFDRERTFPADLAPFAIPARERALVTADPTKTTVSLVPDFSLLLHHRRGTTIVTTPVIGEIETGFSERDPKDIAIAKSWKIRAATATIAQTRLFDGVPLDPGAELRAVIWCRTAAIEQRFFEGAQGVYGNARSPHWITHGNLLRVGIPPGTKKGAFAAAAATLVAGAGERIWRWLRVADPNERRRFLRPSGDRA